MQGWIQLEGWVWGPLPNPPPLGHEKGHNIWSQKKVTENRGFGAAPSPYMYRGGGGVATAHMTSIGPCGCNIVNVIRCHSMSQCHSLSSLTVTKLSCSLQLPSLSLLLPVPLSLPLSLDELVLIDAKEEQKGLQQHSAHSVQIPKITRNLSASRHSHGKFSLQPDTGDILLETTFLVTTFFGVALSHYGP